MSKAYDRVEWGFLREVMRRLGFGERWVGLILECVMTVEYTVKLGGVGGEECGPIFPSRGLRQGDPLSPYLFLFVAEGLSALIRRQEEMGTLHGVAVARGAPRVSHLFFADDSFLFFRANTLEARIVKEILEVYAEGFQAGGKF